MADEKTPTEWRVISETVPGASHIRAGIPNQDSILVVRESSRGLPIVLSVADGHGSPKCFRSDFGSQFAVKKAAQIVGEFLDERLNGGLIIPGGKHRRQRRRHFGWWTGYHRRINS